MLTASKPYLNSRSGSVMTVRNIERRYILNCAIIKSIVSLSDYNPNSFTDIIGHKIINRLTFSFTSSTADEISLFSVCQEYRTGVASRVSALPYAVRFISALIFFVLFDDVVYIIVNSRTAYNAGHRSAAPGLLIYTSTVFVLLHNLRETKRDKFSRAFS